MLRSGITAIHTSLDYPGSHRFDGAHRVGVRRGDQVPIRAKLGAVASLVDQTATTYLASAVPNQL